MAMNDLQASLVMGAIAQDAIKPQRVKDLHAFFARHPEAISRVESILGYGVDVPPPITAMMRQMPMAGGMNLEAANTGFDQGSESDLFGLGAPIQGEPLTSMAESGSELV